MHHIIPTWEAAFSPQHWLHLHCGFIQYAKQYAIIIGSSNLQTYLLKPYFEAWSHEFSRMNSFEKSSAVTMCQAMCQSKLQSYSSHPGVMAWSMQSSRESAIQVKPPVHIRNARWSLLWADRLFLLQYFYSCNLNMLTSLWANGRPANSLDPNKQATNSMSIRKIS